MHPQGGPYEPTNSSFGAASQEDLAEAEEASAVEDDNSDVDNTGPIDRGPTRRSRARRLALFATIGAAGLLAVILVWVWAVR